MFASCIESELALADTNVGGASLSGGRSEPAPPRAACPQPSAEPHRATIELRVSYRAPHECPSSSDFLSALQRHVAAGGSGAIDADVSISRAGETFELALRLRVADQLSETTSRDASCAALMQLAALNASMARTASLPDRVALAAPPAPFEIAPGATLEAAAPLEANAAPADQADSIAGNGDRERRSSGARAFVLGEVRTASGMLPQLAWGQGVSLGIARDALSLRLGATFWQGQRGSFTPDANSPMRLDFEQRSLLLAPCAGRELTAGLRVDACALITGHRVDTNAERPWTYASIGAAALLTLSPWRALRVELEGGLSAALRRPSFAAERWQGVYEPDVTQPSARLALGWEFGGGT